MTDSSTFRTWLKRRRIERGLTQDELGERVSYAGQTIRKIESGQRRPSLQLALRLAQALDLDLAEQASWMHAARAVAEPDESKPAPPVSRPPIPSSGLPTVLTPFIGRDQEQAELAALLDRADVRLVTLLGPGGVGKTRLAIETARGVSGFADGVAFVSLAPVAAPDVIVPAVADALGVVFGGSDDLRTQLLAHLRGRHILLILDNLEHLLDAAGTTLTLIEDVLQHAPTVTLLVTSRERLRLAGEWTLELSGLTVATPATRGQAGRGSAVTLFVEHARRADRSFRLTAANAAAIATICRMVDGLPLGIELAAAWTRLLAPEDIVSELQRGLEAASLASRNLPARHHSLRAVVDHSWQLLDEMEQQVLRRLSVFHGGFARAAATAVAGASLPVLASLVDKSLLRRHADGRYVLHEVIRQYAHAQLHGHAGDATATTQRHATYYLQSVAERETRIKGPEQIAAVAELIAEIDNIRAAWRWAIAHGQIDAVEHAAETMQWLYEFRGWFQEGATLFRQAVEHLRSSAHASTVGAQTLGRMLGHYGYLAIRLGASAESSVALAESSVLLERVNDLEGLGRTLQYQTSVVRWSGDYDEAQRVIDRCLQINAVTGDRHIRAMTLTNHSAIAYDAGDVARAEQVFRAALAEWRAIGNPRGIIWCITSGSVALLARGKYQEAERLLRESLALSHTSDDRYGAAASLRYLGRAAFQQGDVETAMYFFREALPELRSIGNWEYLPVINDLGEAQWQSGAWTDARRTYGQALTTAMRLRLPQEAARAMLGIATYVAREDDPALALRLVLGVLANPASGDEARRGATELQRALRDQLPADQVTQIEQQASTELIDVLLAALELPR